MMKELRLDYPKCVLGRLLNVSASGYYAWVNRPSSRRAQEEVRLELEIRAAHKRTRQTYGPERLQRDLAEHGVRVGICRIKRIRKKLGIRCRQKRRFKATTDSGHRLPVADNILGQQFKVWRPNTVWVSDITYIPTDEGWLYLAGHKDLFTGEIVGYAMDIDLERGTELERDWNELSVIDSLNEILSPDYRLYIHMNGKLESSPRKVHLKRPFENLLKEAEYEELLGIQQKQDADLEDFPKASFDHRGWTVVGHLIPVSPEHRGQTGAFVANGPMKVDHIDDIGKTRDRLYRKARRYKNVDNLVIALRCDISNNRLDEVLFGSQQFTFHVHNDPTDTTPTSRTTLHPKPERLLVQLRWTNQSACDRRRGSLWSLPWYPR